MSESATFDRNALISELGLTVESEFVPWSKSRNAKEKQPSLNWRVTIKRDGRQILTTDYSAGCGHCPSYKHPDRAGHSHRIAYECEHGHKANGVHWSSSPQAYGSPRDKIDPKILDVLYSLVRDADVLDAGGFEHWASDLGYDTDSRTAEKIYQTCLELALKLRSGLGDANLKKLQEAFQDY